MSDTAISSWMKTPEPVLVALGALGTASVDTSVHWKKGKGKKKGRKKKGGKGRSEADYNLMDSVARMKVATNYLNALVKGKGKGEGEVNVKETEVWKLLYTHPIHEKQWTIYSTVINVRTDYYKTVAHYVQ